MFIHWTRSPYTIDFQLKSSKYFPTRIQTRIKFRSSHETTRPLTTKLFLIRECAVLTSKSCSFKRDCIGHCAALFANRWKLKSTYWSKLFLLCRLGLLFVCPRPVFVLGIPLLFLSFPPTFKVEQLILPRSSRVHC